MPNLIKKRFINYKFIKDNEKGFKELKHKYELLQLRYQIVAKWVPKTVRQIKIIKDPSLQSPFYFRGTMFLCAVEIKSNTKTFLCLKA